jgi:streptogramin lyase
MNDQPYSVCFHILSRYGNSVHLKTNYASLAGNFIARIDLISHNATVIHPPTPDQGDI